MHYINNYTTGDEQKDFYGMWLGKNPLRFFMLAFHIRHACRGQPQSLLLMSGTSNRTSP